MKTEPPPPLLPPPINNNYNFFDTQNEQHLFVWPWIGVLANVPIQWDKTLFVGPTSFTLKQQLSENGFNPLRVEVLYTHRGHSGFALVEFDHGSKGLEHATLFEQSFKQSRSGKRDWNDAVFNKLYGWVAREDDYVFEGIVGDGLRKKLGALKDADFCVNEEEDGRMVLHSSEVDGFSLCLEGLIKEKDQMLQRYHQDMREAHHSAQKNLKDIISQRAIVTFLLEAKKEEIEMRSEELSEAELGTIDFEKNMIEKATLEQRNGDNNLVLLAEEHKKQKEKLHRRIIDFEKDIEDKHVLELEIERMRGGLKVMRHMVDAGDDDEVIAERIDTLQEQLKEKEQEYARFKATNRNLFANEELVKHLEEGGSGNMSKGIKRGGDFDSKQFLNVAKRKCSEEKATSLYSEWKYHLQDPYWNPFVNVEGSIKEEMDTDDERLKRLRKEHGDEANNARGKKATLK